MKRQEWVDTRKKLLRKVKAQVLERLGQPTSSLRQYAKKLTVEFRGRWRACDWSQLMRAVTEADVIFGSDFHAHAQSQRAHVRVLRTLPENRRVVLALECLRGEDQKSVDRYLRGECDEDAFLAEVDWQASWGFPWENYRPLFDLARTRGYLVTGLSRKQDARRKQSLKQRDDRMATDIANLSKARPEHLIYVLVGESHLAQSHLPEACSRLRGGLRSIVIYQDAESLYFRLARHARDQQVDVLRSGDRFCLMVSPPWVKWQSYLMFLEQTYDRELDEDDTTVDFSDQVKTLIDLLARDFGVSVSTTELQVYTPNSRETLKRLKKELPRQQWPVLKAHLENNRCFLLPAKGLVYLSSSTINRAASMAGEYVHAHVSRRTDLLWDGIGSLEALIWVEGVAFFFSKWINPKRKAEKLENLRYQLAMASPRDRGRTALNLAVDQRMSEIVWVKTRRRRALRSKPRHRLDVFEAARVLGTMLGQRMFNAVHEGELEVSQFVGWLRHPVGDEEFGSFYRSVLERLK